MGVTIPAESATDTSTGTVELATAAEVTTGTDTERAITPAALADSGVAGSAVTLPSVVGSAGGEGGFVARVYEDIIPADTGDFLTSSDNATWSGGSAIGSAVVSGGDGTLVISHDNTTNDQHYDGTYTAPTCFWAVQNNEMGAVMYEAHVSTTDAANVGSRADFRLIIQAAGSDEPYATIGLQVDDGAGTNVVQAFCSTGSFDNMTVPSAVSPSDAELDTGYWLRVVVAADGSVSVHQYAATAASRPTEAQWVLHGYDAAEFNQDDLAEVEIGFVVTTQGEAPLGTQPEFTIVGQRVYADGIVAVT